MVLMAERSSLCGILIIKSININEIINAIVYNPIDTATFPLAAYPKFELTSIVCDTSNSEANFVSLVWKQRFTN